MSNQDKYINARIKHHKAIICGAIKEGSKQHIKLKAILMALKFKCMRS